MPSSTSARRSSRSPACACKAALGVITLPYSDTYFLSAYPRECTETFQAAHVAGFEFFGGVPLRTSYDNTTIAVVQGDRDASAS